MFRRAMQAYNHARLQIFSAQIRVNPLGEVQILNQILRNLGNHSRFFPGSINGILQAAVQRR